MEKIFRKKLWYITIEQFLMKYMWSLTGQCIIALPLLLSAAEEMDSKDSTGLSQRTKMYTTAKHYLINGGDAAERIMSSYKEVCVCAYVHVCAHVCVCVCVCVVCVCLCVCVCVCAFFQTHCLHCTSTACAIIITTS